MRSTAAILLSLIIATVPGPAPAQNLDFAEGLRARVVREIRIPIAAHGQVTVDFHGEQSAGCEAIGLCTTSGTATWNPGTQGSLVVVEYSDRGQRWLEGSLAFDQRIATEGVGRTGPLTVSTVGRLLPAGQTSTCSDARVNGFFDVRTDPVSASVLDIRLAGPGSSAPATDLIGTRCAGPLQADIAPLLPVKRIESAALLAGRTALDMSATRPFAVKGLAGTLHSSLTLELGTPTLLGAAQLAKEQRRVSRAFGPQRTVAIEYEVERVSGEVLVDYVGRAEHSECASLDSCGTRGTLRVAPTTTTGKAYLSASGPSDLPRHRLRAALGLARGRVPDSVLANGVAWWSDGIGTVAQAGLQGGERCNDTAPLRADEIALTPSRTHVSATYYTSNPSFDQLQTRCAGPSVVGLEVPPLASARVPLRRLAASRVQVRLRSGRTFTANGYAISTRPSLTLVLKRKRIIDSAEPIRDGTL